MGCLTIIFVTPQKTMRFFIVIPDTRITLQNDPFVYNPTHLGKEDSVLIRAQVDKKVK
jgi:hypothetical protein